MMMMMMMMMPWRRRGGGGVVLGCGGRRLSMLGLVLLLLLLLLGVVLAAPAASAHAHEHQHTHAHAEHHHGHGHGHDHEHQHHHHAAHHPKPAAAAAAAPHEGEVGGWLASPWARAFAATTLISVVPTLVLPFIPLASTGADGAVALNEKLHRLLLSFAAGGLLGEVFLHSLPHLLEGVEEAADAEAGHEHEHHHHGHGHAHGHGHGHGAAERVSLWVLAGFLLFFASEKLVKVLLGEEDGGHSHSHSHSHGHAHAQHHHQHGAKKAKLEEEEWEEDEEGSSSAEEDGEGSGSVDGQGLRRRSRRIRERGGRRTTSPPGGAGSSPRKQGPSSAKGRGQRQEQEGHQQSQSRSRSLVGLGGLKASGYLNITVDLLHNFTDGIAIGAAFASSSSSKTAAAGGVGLATTLSVFLHEIPHEIGDFAILVQSGLSLRGAFLMQFCTALAAFAGTLAGLAATRHEGLERVLVGLMAGGFLYVGAVSVLPELLAGKAGPWQAVGEVAGVVGGIGLMMLVGHGEEGH